MRPPGNFRGRGNFQAFVRGGFDGGRGFFRGRGREFGVRPCSLAARNQDIVLHSKSVRSFIPCVRAFPSASVRVCLCYCCLKGRHDIRTSGARRHFMHQQYGITH